MAKIKKAQKGMTMKQLKMKYPDVDTTAKGDVRGSEMNAYAPKKALKKYNDTYNAFDKKFKGGPAKNKMGGKVKKAQMGAKMQSDTSKRSNISPANGKKGQNKVNSTYPMYQRPKYKDQLDSLRKTSIEKYGDDKPAKIEYLKKGGALKKQAAVAIAMKKAGKTPKKMMQYGGSAASMVPPMKMGGSLKSVDKAKNPGLSKLPTSVRNKMGYQKMGGKTTASSMMKMGGKMSKMSKKK
jgi:hypothetical protein